MLSSLSRALIVRPTIQISKLPTTLALMSTAATNGSAAGAGPGLGPARNKRPRHRGRGGQGKKEISTAAPEGTSQPAPLQNAKLDQPGRAHPPRAPPVPAPRPALAPVGVDEASKAMQNQLSDVPFSSFVGQGLSPDMLKRIPYQYCSPVQAATLKPILEGKDVFGRAKTGTGKTMAFLIPLIQRILSQPPATQRAISALIISPTRELAAQIQVEAKKLLADHAMSVGMVVGATNINADGPKLRSHILIATPGRLADHVRSNPEMKGLLSNVKFFVLDEADRLLDGGFQRELDQIIDALPDRRVSPRQALLFSATVTPEIKRVASATLNASHSFISTVSDAEAATHESVPQTYTLIPRSRQFAGVSALLARIAAAPTGPGKVIVFCSTAREAEMWHMVVEAAFDAQGLSKKFPLWAIHSRLSQPKRDKAVAAFRDTTGGVMFASDVLARGIDIKGVTHVLQVGIASDAQQYVHRIGRTARAGESGEGQLIIDPSETRFITHLQRETKINQAQLDIPESDLASWTKLINRALDTNPDILEKKGHAYQAWLGFNKDKSKLTGAKVDQVIAAANTYALETLRYKPAPGEVSNKPNSHLPPLQAKTIGKMGLKAQRGMFHVGEYEAPAPRNGMGRGRGR